jgi:hypothetical protein
VHVDHPLRTEAADELAGIAADGGGDPRATDGGQLDRQCTDSARPAVHQDRLPGSDRGVVDQGLHQRESGQR